MSPEALILPDKKTKSHKEPGFASNQFSSKDEALSHILPVNRQVFPTLHQKQALGPRHQMLAAFASILDTASEL